MNWSNRKGMKWLMVVCALALVVPLALAGCAKAPPPVEKPIVIGGSLPLTGIFADTGKVIKEGYDKWVEDINAKGGLLGRPVKLILYDDTSSVEKAVTLLEKAITVDKVDLLLGGYPGTACSAQMPIAEKYKMVYLSMGGHMHSFMQGYKYSFGPPPLMGEWWYEGFFEWLESLPAKDRPKICASFTMNNPIGTSLLDSIANGCKRLGINLVINEKYDLPLATAEPLVAKAKAANADLFFSNGFFDDGVLTVRAAKALGYNPAFYVQGVGNIIPAWVKELGSDGNYIFSSTVMHNKLPYPGVKELNEWYTAEHRILAPTYFLFGYCWMEALQRGVEGAGSLDQDAIKDYLRTHEISTIGGKFTFDEKGLPPPFSIGTQILKGEVELIWPPDVQTAAPVYPKPAWGK